MIETKLKFLANAATALAQLACEPNKNISAPLGRRIGLMLRACEPEVTVLQAEQQKLLVKYEAYPSKKAPGMMDFPDMEKANGFKALNAEFLEGPVKFDFAPLSRAELVRAENISEMQLMALEDAGMLIDG